MDTKQKGDIGEQAATLHALKKGWEVLHPIGDRLPYDLVFVIKNQFVKIQVKTAWYDTRRENYVVDNRRTKTNRRIMQRAPYKEADFDFALCYLAEQDLFYVFPVETFVKYGSEIHMVEAEKRQRKPHSVLYKDAWELILDWAARKEIRA
ncbi:MAG: group I intron-associated PD-(D/E)XK endonuclease [Candidatus Paceibacterota bacterium]|nr:group I intron-associated PD-(D/E)XK endonuclease [Candidatus Paceibacterota bacterium]